MARPRVFISSTFYDLKQVRSDLERFILEMGYDPILHESGRIAIGSDKEREEFAYKEVELSDILVAIIGSRYGSGSRHQPYSISQVELKRALELGKQVYIFVERSLQVEYATYLNNKDIKDIRYVAVDDVRIYNFYEEVATLPKNNPIFPFETARDITDCLREQWAGLFQRFLQEQVHAREVSVLTDLQATAKTLNELVSFLTKDRRNKEEAIHDILLSNHPAFLQLKTILRVPYRVFFTNHKELNAWLEARSYRSVPEEHWDAPDYEEWVLDRKNKQDVLKLFTGMFDDNQKLKVYTSDEWQSDWIAYTTIDVKPQPASEDDNIPF